jgi:hypothetical protein
MRRAIIPALLLVLVSVVLGATVFREQVAHAAATLMVREANTDAQGNIRVHEQGTANVQAVLPSNSFSVTNTTFQLPQDIEFCPSQDLPSGTKWFVTSFTAANLGTGLGAADINLEPSSGAPPGSQPVLGPRIAVPESETVHLAFPQPFMLTAPDVGYCLEGRGAGLNLTLVGYRRPPG